MSSAKTASKPKPDKPNSQFGAFMRHAGADSLTGRLNGREVIRFMVRRSRPKEVNYSGLYLFALAMTP